MTAPTKRVPMAPPDAASDVRLAVCLPALDVVTPWVLAQVGDALKFGVAQDSCDSLQIAVAEALNNIVEHGYRGSRLGAVVIQVSVSATDIVCDLTDWGCAYPGLDLPNGVLPDPTDLEEGGYGWFLIRSLMTNVTYERRHKTNHLSLTLAR
ncbi:MAG TPA: ATP-binding protein [Marivita sp.]|nr:ATP-binding protein [Marivita sp.]